MFCQTGKQPGSANDLATSNLRHLRKLVFPFPFSFIRVSSSTLQPSHDLNFRYPEIARDNSGLRSRNIGDGARIVDLPLFQERWNTLCNMIMYDSGWDSAVKPQSHECILISEGMNVF
jgi:hypothetical protein